MTNKIGTRFEKYTQILLSCAGVDTKRNLMYHKGKRKRQVDLETKTGLIFPKKIIYECKYVSGQGNFMRDYVQLMETILFTGAHQGVLVTNAAIPQRKYKEKKWGLKIYDQTVLLGLRPDNRKQSLEQQIRLMEKEIRSMPYLRADNKFIHRYL